MQNCSVHFLCFPAFLRQTQWLGHTSTLKLSSPLNTYMCCSGSSAQRRPPNSWESRKLQRGASREIPLCTLRCNLRYCFPKAISGAWRFLLTTVNFSRAWCLAQREHRCWVRLRILLRVLLVPVPRRFWGRGCDGSCRRGVELLQMGSV